MLFAPKRQDHSQEGEVRTALSDPSNSDRMETADRMAIMGLYASRGIVPCPSGGGFRCPHIATCSKMAARHGKDFHTGTWPYVGAGYGRAHVSGHLLRILFVAMERGGTFDPFRKDAPNELTFAHTQMNFRQATELRENAHMGGTSELMGCLVDDKRIGVYSTDFALTNAVKCVEFTSSQNSPSTSAMMSNCAAHLREEITLLRPHLVITQGAHPKDTLLRLFQPMRLVEQFSGQAGLAEVQVGDKFVLLTTPHAARKSGWRWKQGPLPEFLQNAVKRAIQESVF